MYHVMDLLECDSVAQLAIIGLGIVDSSGSLALYGKNLAPAKAQRCPAPEPSTTLIIGLSCVDDTEYSLLRFPGLGEQRLHLCIAFHYYYSHRAILPRRADHTT